MRFDMPVTLKLSSSLAAWTVGHEVNRVN
jgi:hypothetical protein